MAGKRKMSKKAQRKKGRENVITGLVEAGFRINTAKASPFTAEKIERQRKKKLKAATSGFRT